MLKLFEVPYVKGEAEAAIEKASKNPPYKEFSFMNRVKTLRHDHSYWKQRLIAESKLPRNPGIHHAPGYAKPKPCADTSESPSYDFGNSYSHTYDSPTNDSSSSVDFGGGDSGGGGASDSYGD